MLFLLIFLSFICVAVNSQAEAPVEGCLICGDGKVVTKPDALFIFPGSPAVTCGLLQTYGLQGLIPLAECSFLPIIPEIASCDCAPGNLPSATTLAPVIPPTQVSSPVMLQPSLLAPTELLTLCDDFEGEESTNVGDSTQWTVVNESSEFTWIFASRKEKIGAFMNNYQSPTGGNLGGIAADDYLISPPFSVIDDSLIRFEYFEQYDDFSQEKPLSLLLTSDWTGNVETTEWIDITPEGLNGSTSGDWIDVNTDIIALKGYNLQLAFRYQSTSANGGRAKVIGVDNVCLGGKETPIPSSEPTPSPLPLPSTAPSPEPTSPPLPLPSLAPSPEPTSPPLPLPSIAPSPEPTLPPLPLPSIAPSPEPTLSPLPLPSIAPTFATTTSPSLPPISTSVPSSPTEYLPCPSVPSGGCSICGNGLCITNFRAIFSAPGHLHTGCHYLQEAGYRGELSRRKCFVLPSIVDEICSCASGIPVEIEIPPTNWAPKTLRKPPSVPPTISPVQVSNDGGGGGGGDDDDDDDDDDDNR